MVGEQKNGEAFRDLIMQGTSDYDQQLASLVDFVLQIMPTEGDRLERDVRAFEKSMRETGDINKILVGLCTSLGFLALTLAAAGKVKASEDFVSKVLVPKDKADLLNKVLACLRLSENGVVDLEDISCDPNTSITCDEFMSVHQWLAKAVEFELEKPRFVRSDYFDEWRIFFNFSGYRFIWRMSVGQGTLFQLLSAARFVDNKDWPSEKMPMRYEEDFEVVLESES